MPLGGKGSWSWDLPRTGAPSRGEAWRGAGWEVASGMLFAHGFGTGWQLLV